MAASYMLATRKSQYHDSCVPAEKRQIATETAPKTQREGEISKTNLVAKDTIWKQSVDTERRCLKNWETNWGFLAEFDAQILRGSKGNPKEPQKIPEKASIFSDSVPNTNSGNYGNKVGTPLGQAMTKMEYKFYSERRRRKMGSDMVCY